MIYKEVTQIYLTSAFCWCYIVNLFVLSMNQHDNTVKKICFTTMTIVFLLTGFNRVQGQNLTTNLDHLKLANAFFVGSWQQDHK